MDERLLYSLGQLRARLLEDIHFLDNILAEHLGREGQKPPRPTKAYCCLPPNRIRWDGETETQQRLWHLLSLLLDYEEPLPFEIIEDIVYPGRGGKGDRLVKDVSKLNKSLATINFPFLFTTKASYVLRS